MMKSYVRISLLVCLFVLACVGNSAAYYYSALFEPETQAVCAQNGAVVVGRAEYMLASTYRIALERAGLEDDPAFSGKLNRRGLFVRCTPLEIYQLTTFPKPPDARFREVLEQDRGKKVTIGRVYSFFGTGDTYTSTVEEL